MGALINPDAKMPGDDMHPDAIEKAAADIAGVGSSVTDTTGKVAKSWAGLKKGYHAPEQETLFGAMQPATKAAGDFDTDMGKVCTALTTFAGEVRTIRANVDKIRADARTFRSTIPGGKVTITQHVVENRAQLEMGTSTTTTKEVDWDSDDATRDANNALVRRVSDQEEQLWAAERKCANAIRDIYGAKHISARTASNPKGYGYDEIPDNASLSWGSVVSKKEGCGESVAKSVVGGVGDFAGPMITGLSGLVGVTWKDGIPTRSFSTLRNSWLQLGKIATGIVMGSQSSQNAGYMSGPVGNYINESRKAFQQTLGGLVGIDPYAKDPASKWKQDPVRTGVSTVLNIATFFVPFGEAGAGADGAGAAAKGSEAAADAGKAGKAAEAVGDAAKVGDAADVSKLVDQMTKGDAAAAAKLSQKAADVGNGLNDLDKTNFQIPDAGTKNVDVNHPNTGGHDPEDAPPPRDDGQSGYGPDGVWRSVDKGDEGWGNHQKAAYAETTADEYMKAHGQQAIDARHSSTSANGIDGIYRDRTTGKITIVEAKWGHNDLRNNARGRQLSDPWLTSADRGGRSYIQRAIPDDPNLVREVTDGVEDGSVERVLLNVGSDGSVHATLIGSAGEKLAGDPQFLANGFR